MPILVQYSKDSSVGLKLHTFHCGVSVCACTCVCVCLLCMCPCVSVLLPLSMFTCGYVFQLCVHVYVHAPVHQYCVYLRVCMHVCVCMLVCTHKYTACQGPGGHKPLLL